jgi:hypothetical protein
VTSAVLDDHLLRDFLSEDVGQDLAGILAEHEPATTSLYYLRLCKSVVSARGGRLTGSWPAERRRALGRTLLVLPEAITVVPIRSLGFRVAELAEAHRLSTLGAEAVAAAEHLGAPLVVWDGDDGPNIRAAAAALGRPYRTISR